MRPTNNVGYLLNHLAFVLGRQSDQVLQERLGIGFSQFKIMMTLQNAPHIQQKVIADKLGQTEASISRQIKLLLEQNLLQTVRRPENRREHITTLTPKGDRLTNEALEILGQYHAPIMEALTEKQQQALSEALQLMHRAACNGSGSGSCHPDFE